jgi:hypothetical protein
MSYLKLNRIGFVATVAAFLAVAAVEGCSSSGDDQVTPSGGTGGTSSSTGGKTSGGSGGTSSSTAGKGGGSNTTGGTSTNGGTGGNAGEAATPEGGAAGETGTTTPPMCEPAEDHGEAAAIAAHGGTLPPLN